MTFHRFVASPHCENVSYTLKNADDRRRTDSEDGRTVKTTEKKTKERRRSHLILCSCSLPLSVFEDDAIFSKRNVEARGETSIILCCLLFVTRRWSLSGKFNRHATFWIYSELKRVTIRLLCNSSNGRPILSSSSYFWFSCGERSYRPA